MGSRIFWPKILVHCAFLHFIAIVFNILWRFFTHSFYILGTYAYYKRWICSMTSLSAWWPVTWSICIFCSSLLSPCSLFLWLISFYSRFTLNFVNDNKFYTKNLGFFHSKCLYSAYYSCNSQDLLVFDLLCLEICLSRFSELLYAKILFKPKQQATLHRIWKKL